MSVSDASLSGYAVGARCLHPSEVARVGRRGEKFRYRFSDPRPRATALGQLDVLSDVRTVRERKEHEIPEIEQDEGFSEVPPDRLASDLWQVQFAAHMPTCATPSALLCWRAAGSWQGVKASVLVARI